MKAKDYNLIASALAQAKYVNKTSADTRVWKRICLLEASALGAMDTKFNKDKFLQACGIDGRPVQRPVMEEPDCIQHPEFR